MKKNKMLFKCMNCESDIPFKGYTNYHKFCDNQCQGEYRKKHRLERDKKLFFEGKLSSRPNIRSVLTELRGYECEVCKISLWQDKEIVLQVDHKNGNPYDDSPDNLRLICPNCHSQTPNFAGANRGNGRWTKENLSRFYQT
jgi:Zn finger protein HypA/HybF involved in hydrogenase expression